jgi:hypothetical protein
MWAADAFATSPCTRVTKTVESQENKIGKMIKGVK